MDMGFSKEKYEEMVQGMFERHQSVQNVGFSSGAYKPGLDKMLAFDESLGFPSRRFESVHVAGTNGKGSVCHMLVAALSTGQAVGLYTSPHLVDFRERVRTVRPDGVDLIPEEAVYEFLTGNSDLIDSLGLSFFEITTGLAFWWFAKSGVKVAVIETGLGGRLDATNIIIPRLSIITSIGLDHCAILGPDRASIAREKAGIFKRGVPALVGFRDSETEPVFKKIAAETGADLYFCGTELTQCVCEESSGSVPKIKDNNEIELAPKENINLDLRGEYQHMNLRTVLTALDLLASGSSENLIGPGTESLIGTPFSAVSTVIFENAANYGTVANTFSDAVSPSILSRTEHESDPEIAGFQAVLDRIANAAHLTGLRGRWEKVGTEPDIICDIGHNPPALKLNFAQLREMMDSGKYDKLIIVYGIMADKALEDILPMMPRDAEYIFCAPDTSRALAPTVLASHFAAYFATNESGGSPVDVQNLAIETSATIISGSLQANTPSSATGTSGSKNADYQQTLPAYHIADSVAEAVRVARDIATPRSLIYIGGSAFVVAEIYSLPLPPPSSDTPRTSLEVLTSPSGPFA